MNGVEIGDYVTIGKSDLTWEVIDVWPEYNLVFLESGQTGRHRCEPSGRIHFHSKGRTA